MFNEAINRIESLENNYDLNGNVKKYFLEGKLYYSYMTAGGYMGSIDTIDYEPNYRRIADEFEMKTGFVVYHAIEWNDTLSLLYVSNNKDQWPDERPNSSTIFARVCNIKNDTAESGYIKLDTLGGALKRRDDAVYQNDPSRAVRDKSKLTLDLENEAIRRMNILCDLGMITDLNIEKIYKDENDMLFSETMSVGGQALSIINRVSNNPFYKSFVDELNKTIDAVRIYFLIVSPFEDEIACFFIPHDRNTWDAEKEILKEGYAPALLCSNLEGEGVSVRFADPMIYLRIENNIF